jgi:hypothetical protein
MNCQDSSASTSAGTLPAKPQPIPTPPEAVLFIWPRPVTLVLLSSALALAVLWNLMLLASAFQVMPKNDFGRTWYSAVAFAHGQPMYESNEAVEWDIVPDQSARKLWNLNPPHFHLLLLPLVPLEQRAALGVWFIVNLLALFAGLYRVVIECGIRFNTEQTWLAALGLLTCAGVGSTLITMNVSFLLFLVVTLAWSAARHDRWGEAGLWLGLGMSVKPFLLFLVPYLILRGKWRALATAAGATALWWGIGLVVFGPANYRDWLARLDGADHWAWLNNNCSIMGMLSRGFIPNSLYENAATLSPAAVRGIWLAVGIPVGLLTQGVALLDRSPRGLDRAFALLLVGALFLSPLGWTYYLLLPLGPVWALIQEWWAVDESGELRPTRATLRAARWLILAGAVGILYHQNQTLILGRSVWATFTIGSVFFWGTGLIWAALIVDGWRNRWTTIPAA